MTRELMKGNEALAEAAVRAGCDIYAGYPLTPQTEILEYMSWRMPEEGRVFVQSESEIAGISMVFGAAASGFRAITSTSGPGFSLKQEGISYIAACELPCVVVDVARYGAGLGDIWPAQGDYWQVTKNGGHGDYKVLAYAPATVQETVDIIYEAFDKAEKYMNPVIILSDGVIGQMMETVEMPEMKTHDPNHDWAMTGNKTDKHKIIMNPWMYSTEYSNKGVPEGTPAYEVHLRNKYKDMFEHEQRWESIQTEDAEVVLVGYGISSRICKEAVDKAREQGIKLGLIRPISISPFPRKAFKSLPKTIKAFIDVEMSCLGQLEDDVRLASECKAPVYNYYSGIDVPDTDKILEMVVNILNK